MIQHERTPLHGMRLAFVCGLSDKKLAQKVMPLSLIPEVASIDVYRRTPCALPPKVRWSPVSSFWRELGLGELEKFVRLLAAGRRYDALIGCFQIPHGLWADLVGSVWRVPVAQLVISDVSWNINHRPGAWTMLRADACGVRGPGAVTALRALGYTGPVEIIHNPIQLSEIHTPDNLRPNDILVVGDMAEEKDYPWMLDILARLKRRGVSFTATLCGRFPENFRRRVAALELLGQLRFPGHLAEKELTDFYASSRVLLMTSHTEGLPMAVVEAMSHGLATVVTEVGELPWLVRNTVDGYVVPHGNTEAMTDALETVLTRPTLARDMGENGRLRIQALAPLFTPETVAEAWRRLLAKMFQRTP